MDEKRCSRENINSREMRGRVPLFAKIDDKAVTIS